MNAHCANELKEQIRRIYRLKEYDTTILLDIDCKISELTTLDDELKDAYAYLYTNWGYDLVEEAALKDGVAAEKLYLAAFAKYQKALSVNDAYFDAYLYWGVALSYWADATEGQSAELLYRQAVEKYRCPCKSIQMKRFYILIGL